MRFRRLAIKILAGIAGFGTGFLAGMGIGAQITGPVGAGFPQWGAAFIIGMGVWGGVSGAVIGVISVSPPKDGAERSKAIIPDETRVYIDCVFDKTAAAAARQRDGKVSEKTLEARRCPKLVGPERRLRVLHHHWSGEA